MKDNHVQSKLYGGVERRNKLRLKGPFPALVRGVDASGRKFEADAVLDNISAGGFFVRLGRRIEPGAKLFVVTRLSTSQATEVRAARVAVRAVVLRSEHESGGVCAVAAGIFQHRFLSPEMASSQYN